MKIYPNQIICTIDGTAFKKEGGDPLKLKDVCIEALLATYKEESITGKEKLDRYLIAEKIAKHDTEIELDLDVEDIAKIKDLVGKAFGPGIVGPCYKLLNS